MYCNFILAASCLVCDCSFKHTHSFRHTNLCLAFLKVIHFNTQSAFVVISFLLAVVRVHDLLFAF